MTEKSNDHVEGQAPQMVVGGSKSRKKINLKKVLPGLSTKKKVLTAAAFATILVLGTVFMKSGLTDQLTANQCNGGQKSALYTKAQKALETLDQNKTLGSVAQEIKKQHNYAKDPSCVYPLVAYYLRAENAQEAQKNANALQSALTKQGARLAPVYGIRDAMALEGMYTAVAVLVQQKNVESNATYYK